MSSDDPLVLQKNVDPFLTVGGSGPFARMVEAQFVAQKHHEIKRVFLLCQKDEYHLQKNELWPLTNQGVDQCWRHAFLFHEANAHDGSVIILSDPIAHRGTRLPFRSLFFCRSRQVFFHPPCPECGTDLEQCDDDGLLSDSGLQPYSTSLRRYLFCPVCFESRGRSGFYTLSCEPSDPQPLKDRWDLIREFGMLHEKTAGSTGFPCPECPDRRTCYGEDGMAVLRIAPFSFYPFHMMIFGAMSVHAVDFLSLVSGAGFEALGKRLAEKQETGRIRCLKSLEQKSPGCDPFFFHNEAPYFLEVLYLKLSFLCDLIQMLIPRMNETGHPDLALSIDRTWVDLPDQGGRLPFFWNFKVQVPDMVGNRMQGPGFPIMPWRYVCHHLGLIWFYTLLTNAKQDISAVYGLLEQKLTAFTEHETGVQGTRGIPGLSPENIFWDPDDRKRKTVHPAWHHLWEKSLNLGWSLLRVGQGSVAAWSENELVNALEDLRKQVKERLFTQAAATVTDDRVQENRDIHRIVSAVMERWESDLNRNGMNWIRPLSWTGHGKRFMKP